MSNIEWTDETWNPVTGCTKVSAGCAHCYAETVADRFWATQYPKVDEIPGEDSGRSRIFTDIRCHPERLGQPRHWRNPRRVFVNSMSDLFHEAVPDEFLLQVFGVMTLAEQHTFQVLTKRPERMSEFCRDWQPGPNIWLGVSVENQATADARIQLLLDTPAAVRFLSCEPLLGPIEIRGHLEGCGDCDRCIGGRVDQCAVGSYRLNALHADGIHWVIIGGESGPKARPCDVAWIRSIRDQCQSAGVPVFVKQLGSNPYGVAFSQSNGIRDSKGGKMAEWSEDLRVREWPNHD